MHEEFYRTEKERKTAERQSDQKMKGQLLDFEDLLKNYPKKFDISKCLENDRTFPANMPDKVSARLENPADFQKRRMAPAAANRKKAATVANRPALASAGETARVKSTYAPNLSMTEAHDSLPTQ